MKPRTIHPFYCAHCHRQTDHKCLPDVQVPADAPGLLWKCLVCNRAEPHAPPPRAPFQWW